MTEHFKAPEKIQLSEEEIANLLDAQFQTLVIKMLTELVEFVQKLDEKMKAMLRETKENVQGTDSDVKETGTQINGVDQKEERNIQPEKNEETRIRENEERLRNLQDIFKCSNIWITGVPEGEEEEQGIENLFENIIKENSLNLVKEIDFQEVQEAQRVPQKLDPRKHTPRNIIIALAKIKEKERILKAAREKETSYLQRSSHTTVSWFLQRDLTGKKGMERSIWSQERQGPTSKITLPSKAII